MSFEALVIGVTSFLAGMTGSAIATLSRRTGMSVIVAILCTSVERVWLAGDSGAVGSRHRNRHTAKTAPPRSETSGLKICTATFPLRLRPKERRTGETACDGLPRTWPKQDRYSTSQTVL